MPEETLTAVRLAKEGYFPSPGDVLRAPVDEVLAAEDHANFVAVFTETVNEMNKPEET